MSTTPRIRSWTRGSEDDIADGLLAYVTFEHAGLVIDGATVRRSRAGKVCLSFPCRTDGRGRRHALVRLADDGTRQEFERQLLAQLSLVPGVTPKARP